MVEIYDERAKRGISANVAKILPTLIVFMAINIVVKIILKVELIMFLIDALTLTVMFIYYFMASAINETLLLKTDDEYTIDVKNKIKQIVVIIGIVSYMLSPMILLIVSELTGTFTFDNLMYYIMYYITFAPPFIQLFVLHKKSGLHGVKGMTTKGKEEMMKYEKKSAIGMGIMFSVLGLTLYTEFFTRIDIPSMIFLLVFIWGVELITYLVMSNKYRK